MRKKKRVGGEGHVYVAEGGSFRVWWGRPRETHNL
jgi:hypothetical protein